MIRKIAFTIFVLLAASGAMAQHSKLQKSGTATQLSVNNQPFLVLGGELGNSSASCTADIESIFPRLAKMGLNTVLVPIYWDLTEPTEGGFDFTLTQKILDQAYENNLKVVFLWFGAWKNSMSCYAPLWFKNDYNKYPRAYTKEGKPLEIASAFSENVFEADNNAFSQWMNYVAQADKDKGTVIMIQIENEIGMLEDARDYSKEANAAFNAPIPSRLMNYLQKNKKKLHPSLLKKWETNGYKKEGTWQEVFGDDLYTDEIFMAWQYANYVERLAQTARRTYDVPLFVNAAMNSRNRQPGEYPSAGPLAHLIDIWQCGAPTIDFLSPDIYDTGFSDWCAKYDLPNNPLFIPETRLCENNGARAFYVFGEHDAIGISPFSIEDGSESPESSLVMGYNRLKELAPIISAQQGKGTMNGVLFDEQAKERVINKDNMLITARHYFTLPWDARATDGSTWPEGGGIIIELGPYEYIVAGNGIVVEFATKEEANMSQRKQLGEDGFAETGLNSTPTIASTNNWQGVPRVGIGTVDEVNIASDGNLKYIRRLNGDQTHQGRHVRIPVGQYSILHVKLYEYK